MLIWIKKLIGCDYIVIEGVPYRLIEGELVRMRRR